MVPCIILTLIVYIIGLITLLSNLLFFSSRRCVSFLCLMAVLRLVLLVLLFYIKIWICFSFVIAFFCIFLASSLPAFCLCSWWWHLVSFVACSSCLVIWFFLTRKRCFAFTRCFLNYVNIERIMWTCYVTNIHIKQKKWLPGYSRVSTLFFYLVV